MISLPFRRTSQGGNIDALYGMIVAQARSPEFYRGYGVPDTVDGRLDMIVLHMALVLRQLTKAHGALPPVSRTRNSHDCSASTFANFGSKRDTGIIELPVSLWIGSSLRSKI